MRVLIADDQPDVRSALCLLLEQQPGISVVGEVTDTSQLSKWLRANSADLVLLDWELPGQQASELLAALRTLCPNVAVIALNSCPQTRRAALTAGADDFVSKGDPPEQLLAAINYFRRNRKGTGNRKVVLTEAKPERKGY